MNSVKAARMSKLSDGEAKILNAIVDDAAEQMSNRSCNDFDMSEYLSNEELNELTRFYYKQSGYPEDFDLGRDNRLAIPDYELLQLLLRKLLD